MIATVDDHEFADGAWRDGSDNHVPERDGPWDDRKAAAIPGAARVAAPAPGRIRMIRHASSGASALVDLADLFLIDTRSRRDQPVAGDRRMTHRGRSLGPSRRHGCSSEIDGSTARWRLLGNASVLSQTWTTAIRPELREGLTWLKLIQRRRARP